LKALSSITDMLLKRKSL